MTNETKIETLACVAIVQVIVWTLNTLVLALLVWKVML